MTLRSRPPVDHRLRLKTIPVIFLDGTTRKSATAEGNNAAWSCTCGEQLVGRCYFQFGDTCYTVCGSCGKQFRVEGDASKRAIKVGDLLVTGEKPGTAMSSEAVELGGIAMHRPGTILGKALEPLASGEGEILVLLSLQ